MRHVFRPLALLLLLPPAALLLFLLLGQLLEKGTTVCMICASTRDETLFIGIPIHTEPAVPREEVLEAYNRWFEDELAVPHSHSRRPIGCWSVGWSGVACSTFWGESFYGVVPGLPDQEVARRLAKRMLDSPRREQLEILQECVRVRCGIAGEPTGVDLPQVMIERLVVYGVR